MTDKRKAGRPKGSKNKPKFEEKILDMGEVVQIPLSEIHLEDESFRFRAKLKINDLKNSIAEDGQQVPVILRPANEDSGFKYQVVSGFRRLNALRKLRWEHVNAIIRQDLDDDEQAFRVSIIENEARKTYNDMDRALAIIYFKYLGKTNKELGSLFNLSERQLQRIQKLVTFPEDVQDALAEEILSSTHAIRLMQHKDKYPNTDLAHWLNRIKNEDMSMKELNKALAEEATEVNGSKPVELFKKEGKGEKRSYRIRPISVSSETPTEQLAELKKQINELNTFVEKLLK